ncbi:hypothetical protein METY_1759 [Methylopila sp. Yamaguchi]|nr:hypothetical protein METY_1759 [Methylopila sp. Yamaguchi]
MHREYQADDRYDALVDAIMDLEPDPIHGFVDRDQIKIMLAEHGIFPLRMAIPIIEDEARDREIELRRGYVERPVSMPAPVDAMV